MKNDEYKFDALDIMFFVFMLITLYLVAVLVDYYVIGGGAR